MMNKLAALATLLAYASATYSGFNYGSTNTDGSAVTQARFEQLFQTAQGLPGTNGQFTAARLYTMIQAGTANGVISAIPAAINTNTYLLLGLWASAGQTNFDNEIAALKAAISQYGTAFTSRIAGISVGSEDLYRISPTGIANDSGAGADPATLVNYINQVRAAIAGTAASGAQITHVDTWTAWANSTNSPVAQAVDFLSMDAYPYFEGTTANGIDQGKAKLYDAIGQTQAAAPGKPVWVTETGWPVSGPTMNQAVASVANAKQYWDDVECTLKGNYNMFWYTLQDSYPVAPPPPSFGIIGSDLTSGPLFDLTCPSAGTSSSAIVSTTSSVVSSSGSAVSTSVSTTTSVSSTVISSSSASATSTTSPLPVVSTATTAAFSPSASATASEPSSIVGTGSRTTVSVGSTSAVGAVGTGSTVAAASSSAASVSSAISSLSSKVASASVTSPAQSSAISSASVELASASSVAQSAQSAISSASMIAATATGSAAVSVSSALASASSALSSATKIASSAASVVATATAAPSASVSLYVPGNGAAAVAPGLMAVVAGIFAYTL